VGCPRQGHRPATIDRWERVKVEASGVLAGACADEDVAARVLTRVIGHYPAQNMMLVDLGWTGCSAQGAELG
jgi:D-serine deaminase-like pyridoxal phosphate-dependent protein